MPVVNPSMAARTAFGNGGVKAGPSRSSIIGTVTMAARAETPSPVTVATRTPSPDQSMRVTGLESATGRPSARRAR